MAGLPKVTAPDHVLFHSTPLKLFHEVPSIGNALCRWLEELLKSDRIAPADIVDVQEGLQSVNSGLDRMRKGQIRGGKLIIKVS